MTKYTTLQKIEKVNFESFQYVEPEPSKFGKYPKHNFAYFNSLTHLHDTLVAGDDLGKLNKNQNFKGKYANHFNDGDYQDMEVDKIFSEYVLKGKILTSHFKEVLRKYHEVKSSKQFVKFTKSYIKSRGVKFGQEGSDIDIDRVMSGEFEYWRKQDRVKRLPVVKICINNSGLGNQNNEYFLNTAIVGYVVSRILEASNKTTQIDLAFSSIDNKSRGIETLHTFVNVKQHDKKIDFQNVCVSSIPSVFRRLVFGLRGGGYTKTAEENDWSSTSYKNEIPKHQYDVIINAVDVDDIGIEKSIENALESVK